MGTPAVSSIADIVAAVEDHGAIFFYITMSAGTNLHTLVLPHSFVEKHFHQIQQAVTLSRFENPRRWKLVFVKESSRNSSRIVSITGWREFVVDNSLSNGEFILFEVIQEDQIQVSIFPRDDGPTSDFSLQSSSMEVSVGKNDGKNEVGSVHSYYGFEKTLRMSHSADCKNAKLDVPKAFWEIHGVSEFRGKVYQLIGPVHTVPVKSSTYTKSISKVVTCHLQTGWLKFVRTNNFEAGEKLRFTMTETDTFVVTLVA